jgi:hypothetical protein
VSITYVATFDRIGRNHDVPAFPGKAPTDDGDMMAYEIHRYARRFLSSRDYEVLVYTDGTGAILAGGRDAGTFTWAVP